MEALLERFEKLQKEVEAMKWKADSALTFAKEAQELAIKNLIQVTEFNALKTQVKLLRDSMDTMWDYYFSPDRVVVVEDEEEEPDGTGDEVL